MDWLVVSGALLVVVTLMKLRASLTRSGSPSVPDQLYARLRSHLGDPRVPFAGVVLPGDPEVRLEERVDGAWLFVARWPAEVPMAPRDPLRAAWTPNEALFSPSCGTVTPQALEHARALYAVFAIDALRVPWADPDQDPGVVVAQLRGLWHQVVNPAVEALAEGVVWNGALRAANLRALAVRDRERAREVARAVLPEDGVWLFSVALAVAGDVDDLVARVRGTGETWMRVASVRALGELTEPDALLPLVGLCSASPETAVAFAESVATHRTPARDRFVRQVALGSLRDWPEPAARRLALAAFAASPRDEEVLAALLRAPGESVGKALAALAAHGTVASVPALRACIASGAARGDLVEPVILAIQARASGARGGLAVAEVTGGALSEVADGGRLAEADRERRAGQGTVRA
jgi:hypothetical protein